MIKRIFLSVWLVLVIAIGCFAGSQQQSNTLGSTIIANVRSYLNEPTASLWTDTELLVWINDGLLDIVTRSRCLEDTKVITLCDNQLHYDLVQDFIEVSRVIYTDGSTYTGLTQGNPRNVGNTLLGTDSAFGEPVYWYRWSDQIGFYPLADTDVSGHTVTVYVVPQPDTITSTDTVPIPGIYDRALTLFAAAMAKYKMGQFGSATVIMADYQAEMDHLRSQYNVDRKEPEELIRP